MSGHMDAMWKTGMFGWAVVRPTLPSQFQDGDYGINGKGGWGITLAGQNADMLRNKEGV